MSFACHLYRPQGCYAVPFCIEVPLFERGIPLLDGGDGEASLLMSALHLVHYLEDVPVCVAVEDCYEPTETLL